jgi:methionine-rich copper-binding protein CopC
VIRSIPQNRVVLERPPTRLQYRFSEALEPDFSAITLRNQAGEVLAHGQVDADDNNLLSLRLPNDLPDGAYLVELRPAFASDGHVIVETRVFFVGK